MKMLMKVVMIATSAMLCNHVFAYNGGYENGLLSDTTIGGVTYKGYGNNTVTAREESGTTIAANKYAQCKKLKSVNLTGVTSIGNASFAYSALESVTIPSTVTSIGYIAFGGCTNLTSVTLYSYKWHDASKEAFRDCSKLVTATVGGGVPSWSFAEAFPAVRTVRCPKANMGAWKMAYPSMTVLDAASNYSIQFIKNDGAGTLTTKKFDYGVATKLPTISELGWVRNGMTFKGWATSSARAVAGTIWKTDGATVATPTAAGTTMDAIAVWELKSGFYGIKYNKNDGTGKWRSAAYKYGVKTTLPSCGVGLGWTRDGYKFKGWSFTANGVVWKGDRGVVQTGIPAGTIKNLYAIWEKETPSYSIQFIKNDGAGTLTTKKFGYGVATKLPTISELGWVRNGMTFKGWATSSARAVAGTIWKTDGATVATPTAAGTTMNAIAVWELKSGFYGIKYNKNDGTGRWRSAAYKYGVKTILPSCGVGLGWTRDGYTFKGWALSAEKAASGEIWKPDRGTIITGIPAGKTWNLYAIWQKNGSKSSLRTACPTSAVTESMEDVSDMSGFLTGRIAEDAGFYDLLLDAGGETGFVRIALSNGETFTAEVEIVYFDDTVIVVHTSQGEEYMLML